MIGQRHTASSSLMKDKQTKIELQRNYFLKNGDYLSMKLEIFKKRRDFQNTKFSIAEQKRRENLCFNQKKGWIHKYLKWGSQNVKLI